MSHKHPRRRQVYPSQEEPPFSRRASNSHERDLASHNYGVDYIFHHPIQFGIENVHASARNVPLYELSQHSSRNPRRLGEIDIVFFQRSYGQDSNRYRVTLIEYKSNGNGSASKKAATQLTRAERLFRENTPYREITTRLITSEEVYHAQAQNPTKKNR